MKLESVINKIRNILRNEGITGMSSINHCLAFIVLRSLDLKQCKELGIPEKYAFENFSQDNEKNELGETKLYNKFYKKSSKKDSFYKYLKLKLDFTNIQFKIKDTNNLKNIIKTLKKIDTKELSNNYDLVGTIYEIHLKSGTTNAMRDLGQYFTHRLVIEYMIKLCDPKMINKKEIETIVDPTMGTGGFITMAIKYLNKKYKKINWNSNKENIYGFDIDENVTNMAKLNAFLETRVQFNKLVKQDTLKNDMTINDFLLEKADVILANEPMGIKNITHAGCCNRIKDLKIRGTKAEPLFLQLFMKALNDNGRCAVVVPDGVLFNESNLHKGTRKYLIEKFNLLKVISLNDKGFFLNTGVSTSILFFKNDENKTKEVEYLELNLNDNKLVEKEIVKVSYDKLVENDYSLFVNKYIIEEEGKFEGIEYKKLCDICNFLPKSKRKASYGEEQGQYRFYTSSIKSKKCNTADYNEEALIIGTGGNANIKYDCLFSCSTDNFVLANKKDNVSLKFVFYYLKNNMYIIESGFSGSTIKHISKKYIQNIEIPIPDIYIQNKIVEQLDIISENNKTCEKSINEFNKIMNFYVDTHTKSGKEVQMKDICNFKSGKFNSRDCKKTGNYPFYNGKANNPSGFLDNYCFDYPEYLILIKDGGAGYKKYGEQIGLGKVFKVKNKSAATSHQLAISIKKDILCNNNYLYYFLKSKKNSIMDLAHYTTGLGTIRKSNLEKFKIKLIPKEKQEEISKYCDNLSNLIKNLEKQMEDNNILMKQILEGYLNSNYEQLIDNSSEEEIELIEKIEEKSKKTKKIVNNTNNSI